jgi:hypothetical protein
MRFDALPLSEKAGARLTWEFRFTPAAGPIVPTTKGADVDDGAEAELADTGADATGDAAAEPTEAAGADNIEADPTATAAPEPDTGAGAETETIADDEDTPTAGATP